MSKLGLTAGGYTATTSGTDTDLVPLVKAQEDALRAIPKVRTLKEVSFIPTSDCTIKINDGSVIPVTSTLGYSNDSVDIYKFVVVETAITFNLAYNF